MKKGLRRPGRPGRPETAPLKPCPDEEGIKTPIPWQPFSRRPPLKPCPDEEGIKTSRALCPGDGATL